MLQRLKILILVLHLRKATHYPIIFLLLPSFFPSILPHITLMSHHFSLVSLPSSLLMQTSHRHCCILQIGYTNVYPLRLSCSLECYVDISMLWRPFTHRVIRLLVGAQFFFKYFTCFTWESPFSTKSKSSLRIYMYLFKNTVVFIRYLQKIV